MTESTYQEHPSMAPNAFETGHVIGKAATNVAEDSVTAGEAVVGAPVVAAKAVAHVGVAAAKAAFFGLGSFIHGIVHGEEEAAKNAKD